MSDTFRVVDGIFMLGDRAIPWAIPSEQDLPGRRPNGVHIKFENGMTLSIQWSLYNYCDGYVNRLSPEELFVKVYEPRESPDAEIAIWDHEDRWMKFPEGDTVLGYQTVEEVEAWITAVSAMDTDALRDEPTWSEVWEGIGKMYVRNHH